MAVRVAKPEFNVREKLTELDLPKGNHGTQVLKSNSLKETCELVGSGRRNLLINGGFDIWQRGTTFTTPGAPYYAADRWNIYRASSSLTTTTRQSFTLGQQEVPGNPKYFMRVDNTPDADGTWIEMVQHVEDVTQFSDKWVTLSFWMRSNKPQENNEDYWGFYYNFGTGGSPSGSMMAGITPNFDIYTQWSYYEFPVYLPDIQNKTLGTDGVNTSSMKIHLLRQSAVAADTYYDIANVQLEFGRGATPFEKRPIEEELSLCQRYYQQIGPASSSRYILAGGGNGTSRIRGIRQLVPEMRIAPSVAHNIDAESPTFYAYDGSPPSYTSVNSITSTTKDFAWDFNTGTHNQQGSHFDVKGSGAFITINADYAW